MKYSIIICVFFIFLISTFSCNFHRRDGLNAVDRDDFRDIENLYLVGVVYSTQKVENKMHGYHGRGIVRVNVIRSSMDAYDPRNSQANYYCIIKEGKAEIYEHPGNLNKGDTIILDVKKRKMTYHYNQLNKNFGGLRNIWIGPPSFFDFINEKGYQFGYSSDNR